MNKIWRTQIKPSEKARVLCRKTQLQYRRNSNKASLSTLIPNLVKPYLGCRRRTDHNLHNLAHGNRNTKIRKQISLQNFRAPRPRLQTRAQSNSRSRKLCFVLQRFLDQTSPNKQPNLQKLGLRKAVVQETTIPCKRAPKPKHDCRSGEISKTHSARGRARRRRQREVELAKTNGDPYI